MCRQAVKGAIASLFPGQEQRQCEQQNAQACADRVGQITLANVDEFRRYRGDGRAAGNPQQNPPESQHAPQPDNERRNAQVGSHVAVGEADQQSAQGDKAQVRQQRYVVDNVENGRDATEQAQQ
ncbi:hypothetical protein D3C87_1352360 [compost metagenome]